MRGSPFGPLMRTELPVNASHRASRVTVGVGDHPDAAWAARAATEQALRDGPATPPACALLFSTSRHDPGELLTAVRAGLGADVPIYGGWAVGIISADMLGYDGFQIGMALFWLEDAEVNVLVGRGLAGNESAVGRDLVERLRTQSFRGNPSLLLLYDSVNRTGNALRLNMATPLLDGHFSRLPEDIPLAGAGLVGDMQCRSTYQWTGSEVETQAALLLAFSGNIEIEPVVVHGCRPASAYHRITRVDSNVVLEIDDRPALDVVGDLLGAGSGRSWRDYRFFVTLGLNKGERYGDFDPNLYANRMCMAVDAERRGLVMFEPDLREGDLVQLMLRNVDGSYITQTIDEVLRRRSDRKPIFALYIDCAGRASAYSHLDEEEAVYVQSALKDVCPLLGFYSGVEIARVAGAPQALDWTGVLCFFFEREVDTAAAPIALLSSSDVATLRPSGQATADGLSETHRVLSPEVQDPEELKAALHYYRRHLDQAAGDQVRFDARLSALNRRLRQKEEGFRILDNLRRAMNVNRTSRQIYQEALGLVLSTMLIDRAVILEEGQDGGVRVVARAGYSEPDGARLDATVIDWPDEIERTGRLVANQADKTGVLIRLRTDLQMPCFLAVPIPDPRRRAALVVGREREIAPFFPPFDAGDVDNYRAIASFLASLVDNVHLYHEAEQMAASFRRFVPEAFLDILNRANFKDIELGDQVARHMSVLVTDIRSFTTLCERLTPVQVFTFVNEFLAEVGPVIRRHNGFVNKYIGDAVMALFDDASDALRAAVSLNRQIEIFNERRRKERAFPVQIGIGVNSGDLMLGAIGEAERLEGSVLADAVNLCFRLEGLTKTYGAQILTTDETLSELPEGMGFITRPIDLVTVKGRRNHVTIVEILDGLSEARLGKRLATRDLYGAGFQNFEFGAYEEAARTFGEVAKLDPEDRAARAMMLKARKLAEGASYLEE